MIARPETFRSDVVARHDEHARCNPDDLQVRNTFWCSRLAAPSCLASPPRVLQFGASPDWLNLWKALPD